MNITLLEAENVISRAKIKANQLNVYMNIAIVDAGANLLTFARMDGAVLGAIDIAIKKAKTARLFNKETGVLGELSQPNGPLFNIEHSNGGLITFPGGIPIKNADGDIIGAIGVSGSSIENDFLVAEYAVTLLQ
ncbi:heme-binding protein [uncultured Tenacibaculum sp.]|uniref:GlcG/HbpS family heme-binding protein n=1 Tax=uncultured Tenacibaculum sp. TaxID=174713 RepID=UPI002602D997|nr:heme-binding protein [uncultured Tenacibaculum sp.]